MNTAEVIGGIYGNQEKDKTSTLTNICQQDTGKHHLRETLNEKITP